MPAGKLMLSTLDGDLGAAGSIAIVAPGPPKNSQVGSSSRAVNDRSLRDVMPVGSFPRQTGVPLGGGGGVTGSEIVIEAPPLFPSEAAVMVTTPPLTVLTRPMALTVASAVLELDHEICRPVRTLLFASRKVAVSCSVSPNA